jgi:tetratricopeptide (TPR) repeat protein
VKEKMMKSINLMLLVIGVLMVAGCSSSEERQEKYLEKAKVYFEEENYDKVRVELKNVLQINPKNADARYLFALVAEKDLDWRKMYGNLLAVIEENPEHIEAHLKLGKLFLFSKDVEKASEKVELVLAKNPQNTDALALKATILLTQNKKQEARALLEQALASDPGHIDSALLMIRFLGSEKKMAEAMQVLDKTMAAHPEVIKLPLVKVNILMAEGKKAEAEELYVSLVKRFPENQNLHYNLAKFYVVEKKVDQGEQVLKKLIDQLPDEDQPKLAYVDYLVAQRGKEKAEAEITRLIKENPDNFSFQFARLKLHKDDPVVIKEILEQIVAEDKLGASGIDARTRLAALAMSKGELEEARKLIEEVIELDPRNAKALQFRAGFLIKEENFDAAIADVRTILRDDPESEKALMLLAIAQLRAGNNDLAQEALEKVLMVNSKNLPASKDLARMMVKKKDEAGALGLLEKAHGYFKEDIEVSVMLIDLYGKRGDWKKAEEIAKQLAKNNEKSEVGHYKLAQLYLGQKKPQEAITELKKVLAIKPLAIDALSGLINSYIALGQVTEAEKYLDKRLVENKDNLALLTLRGELHRQQNQLNKAEGLFKRVIALKPKFGPGYQKLAAVYLLQNSVDKAIDVYNKGINEAPKNISLLMKLATLTTAAQKTNKAIDAYKKILIIAPDNVMAANNLAALLVVGENPDGKNLKQALTLVEKLKDSKHSAFLDTYGWVNFLNGNNDQAQKALESAVNTKNSIPEMHYHLAMVYLKKGNDIKAKRHLQKAIDAKQGYDGLDKAKQALEQLQPTAVTE